MHVFGSTVGLLVKDSGLNPVMMGTDGICKHLPLISLPCNKQCVFGLWVVVNLALNKTQHETRKAGLSLLCWVCCVACVLSWFIVFYCS